MFSLVAPRFHSLHSLLDCRFTNSFTISDLPVLERVLKLAQDHVEQLETLIGQASTYETT